MHLLRSRYLDSYERLVRPPYTSDPYPITSLPLHTSASSTGSSDAPPAYTASHASSSSPAGPLPTQGSTPSSSATRREAHTLDLYIAAALKRELEDAESDMMIADTSMQDIFTILQPQSRLEDLVMEYGVRAKVLQREAFREPVDTKDAKAGRDEDPSVQQGRDDSRNLVRPSSIQCSFSPRKAALRLSFAFTSNMPQNSLAPPRTARRNVVEVDRAVQDSLEDTAKALLRGLRRLHFKRHARAEVEWYEITTP